MRVPVSAPVFGYKVKIRYSELARKEENGDPVYGQYEPETQVIDIYTLNHTNEASLTRTIYHELGHVFATVSGNAEWMGGTNEEAFCEMWAHAGALLFVFGPKSGVKYKEVEMPWEQDE